MSGLLQSEAERFVWTAVCFLHPFCIDAGIPPFRNHQKRRNFYENQ
nr:MAG TPA: hypothetical protein [Caudoviricetes sp.]